MRRGFRHPWALSLGLFVVLLGLWEAAVRLFQVPRYILPPPSRILAEAVLGFQGYLPHIATTLGEMLLGILLAYAVALPLALLMDRFPVVERALFPVLIGSQAVPVFALAPLLVLWFGYGIPSKVVMASLIVFFPVVVNTRDGLRAADPDLVALLRPMGASDWQIFRKVRAYAALPYLFSGTRIAVSVSTIGAVIGEWVGSTRGLGYLMLHANAQLRVDVVFVAILYLTVLGVGLFYLVAALERLVLPWHRANHG